MINGIDQWIAFVDRFDPFTAEILDFEREDHKQPIYIFADLFDTRLFPRPHLWGNVVVDGNTDLFGETGYAEIESGIIDQNQYIGLESRDVSLALVYLPEDGAQVK